MPNTHSPIDYMLAALPILVVLGVMVGRRWGGQRAGPLGWLVGVAVAALGFGLNLDVLWVSQAKGLLLSLFVLAVLWPALLLYNIVAETGGIRAIAHELERLIADRGLRLIVVAWAFSGMLEGLAGFGLPIAIVAPMLVDLGVGPVIAVAAVAIGHAWSVTFGDMGVIFQTLVAVTKMDGAMLAPTAALTLGAACLGCGLCTAAILRQRRWGAVILLGVLMALTQYLMAVGGLTSLAAFGAGLMGMLGGIALGGRKLERAARTPTPQNLAALPQSTQDRLAALPRLQPLGGALLSYGGLTLLMSAIALLQPLNQALGSVVWRAGFPEVTTQLGQVTPAGSGQVFRPLVHPGTSILLIALASYFIFRHTGLSVPGLWSLAVTKTWRSAAPASIGIITMVGLSTLMEHSGMTQLLALGLSRSLGAVFPLVSPLVGILGAFATGSNNNSNVLFAPLQQNVAALLAVAPTVLLSAQTAGGALGSMIAPAKIIVGCSTVGLKGKDGEVLRHTLPYALVIGLGVGMLALLLAYLQ